MSKQKEAGIYMIRCLVNNRIYIGQSRDLKTRLLKHKRHLRDGIHENKALQSAWDKYKENCFEFTILETYNSKGLDEILNSREKELIAYYRSNEKPFGYNHTDGGGSFKMNEEVIRRGDQVSKVLSEQDVIDIRNYIENDEYSCSELAKKYNVHIQTIHYIRRGDNWTHITKGQRVGKEFTFNRGEENWTSKLTEEDVQNIIVLLETGKHMPEIAKMYGLSKDTISNIRYGDSWAHITHGKVNKVNIPLKGVEVPSAKLTDKEVADIVEKYKKGARRKDLLSEFNIANTTLRELLAGNTWSHITGGKKVEREVIIGLNKERAEEAIKLFKKGMTQREISKKLGVAPTTIFSVLNGDTWKEVNGGVKIQSPIKRRKLSADDVREIAEMLKSGRPIETIAKAYDISISHIKNIKNKSRWRHVTEGML